MPVNGRYWQQGDGGGESKTWPITWPGSLSITWDVVIYYGELPGGIPGKSWWGCPTRFAKSWPYFTTSSPGRFSWLWRCGVPPPKQGKSALGTRLTISDLASKIHILFQTWRRQKLCYHYLARTERQQKDFEFAYYSFLLIRLELKQQIRSCIPSKTMPEFKPK